MSVQIESDLKEFFDKFEKRFDKIDEKLENIDSDITELKVGQEKLLGKIDCLRPRSWRSCDLAKRGVARSRSETKE